MVAGGDLGESVRNAIGAIDGSEVGYVQFDPAGDTLQLCGFGPTVSALHVTNGSVRLLDVGLEVECHRRQPFTLRAGEALVLVAHPRIWARHLLAAMDHVLSRDLDGLDESDAHELCLRLEAVLAGTGLSSVVIYRSGSTAICSWDFPQRREDSPAALDMFELTLPDLEWLDELAPCLVC
jgi:hypothetical protein